MKRKSICQACGTRDVQWERVSDRIEVDGCACGEPGFSYPMCTCERCGEVAK